MAASMRADLLLPKATRRTACGDTVGRIRRAILLYAPRGSPKSLLETSVCAIVTVSLVQMQLSMKPLATYR